MGAASMSLQSSEVTAGMRLRFKRVITHTREATGLDLRCEVHRGELLRRVAGGEWACRRRPRPGVHFCSYKQSFQEPAGVTGRRVMRELPTTFC